jgi:hypothetical protein
VNNGLNIIANKVQHSKLKSREELNLVFKLTFQLIHKECHKGVHFKLLFELHRTIIISFYYI